MARRRKRNRTRPPVPAGPDPLGIRYEWPAVLAIALILFTVYAFSAPRSVTLEDDGLFIVASMGAGVAHPPGYPLYTILGYLFSFLPIDPPAFRIHLLSGVLGALAGGVLFLIMRRVELPRLISMAAALAYGLSEHFWSQAIIAEVYTLNALLCFTVILFCLRALRKNADLRWELCWAALCFGLGMANHWPLVVAAAPALLILLLPRIKEVLMLRTLPLLTAVATLPPVLLYSWMVWRSQNPEVISFYGPLESFEEFRYYFSRQGYGSVDTSPSAKIFDKLQFTGHFLRESLFLFTPVGAALAAAGLYQLYRERRHQLLAATVWIFFAHSLLLILMLGFDYEFLNLAVFRPYPLVGYAMLAFWMGCGLTLLWNLLRGYLQARLPRPVLSAAVANGAAALAMLIPLFLLQHNLAVNERRDEGMAERYARVLMEELEPNSVLFVTGDLPTAPVGYMRYAEEFRPDVQVMNTQGLVYPSRLFSPPVTKQFETDSIANFIENDPRPIYYTTNIVDFPNPYGSVLFGLYRKVQRGEHELQLRLPEHTERHFASVLEEDSPDRWNRHLHDRLMQQYGEFVGYMVLSEAPDPVWNEKTEAMVAAMQDQYFGLIGMAEMLIKYGDTGQLQTVQQWLQRAEGLKGETLSKEMEGRHYYRLGYVAYRLGQLTEAEALFRRALEVHDHPDNPAWQVIDDIPQN